jgi:hypothetical protein
MPTWMSRARATEDGYWTKNKHEDGYVYLENAEVGDPNKDTDRIFLMS